MFSFFRKKTLLNDSNVQLSIVCKEFDNIKDTIIVCDEDINITTVNLKCPVCKETYNVSMELIHKESSLHIDMHSVRIISGILKPRKVI